MEIHFLVVEKSRKIIVEKEWSLCSFLTILVGTRRHRVA